MQVLIHLRKMTVPPDGGTVILLVGGSLPPNPFETTPCRSWMRVPDGTLIGTNIGVSKICNALGGYFWPF